MINNVSAKYYNTIADGAAQSVVAQPLATLKDQQPTQDTVQFGNGEPQEQPQQQSFIGKHWGKILLGTLVAFGAFIFFKGKAAPMAEDAAGAAKKALQDGTEEAPKSIEELLSTKKGLTPDKNPHEYIDVSEEIIGQLAEEGKHADSIKETSALIKARTNIKKAHGVDFFGGETAYQEGTQELHKHVAYSYLSLGDAKKAKKIMKLVLGNGKSFNGTMMYAKFSCDNKEPLEGYKALQKFIKSDKATSHQIGNSASAMAFCLKESGQQAHADKIKEITDEFHVEMASHHAGRGQALALLGEAEGVEETPKYKGIAAKFDAKVNAAADEFKKKLSALLSSINL